MSVIAFDRSVRFFDRAGHMHVEMANISKACVSPYLGSEIPDWRAKGLAADRVYYLLRDPETLRQAAKTFSGKPIVLKHRAQMADDHARDITIGAVGEVTWKAPYLRAPLTVWDGAGIEAIRSGTQRELSPGYFFDVVMVPGTYEGQAYDGYMNEVVGNHLAIVPEGRQGPDVMVGDAKPTAGRWRSIFNGIGRDSAMSDPAGGIIAGEQLNLQIIDSFRKFLKDKLTPSDMAEFDGLWMPFVSDLTDARPSLAGDRRLPQMTEADIRRFNEMFGITVPLKHL